MTEPQDVLAEALRATYDGGDGLGYRLVLMDESGGISTTLPDTFIEAVRAALVRTPETLDVADEPSLREVVAKAEAVGNLEWANGARFATEWLRPFLLAASPAPDPGAGLREALEDAMVTLHHISDDAEFRLAAIVAMTSPPAEPPETET